MKKGLFRSPGRVFMAMIYNWDPFHSEPSCDPSGNCEYRLV